MQNVLIVGCGNIAGGYETEGQSPWPLTHAGAYRRHGGFRLAGCVDPDPARRAEFQQRWGVAEAFADLDQAFAAGRRYDLAAICSPTALHEGHLAELQTRPVRLLVCEKPLGTDLVRVRTLVQSAAAAGIGLAVNYTRRWDPQLAALRHELATGAWGEVRTAAAFYTKGLFNNGSHAVDTLTALLGPMEPLYATISRHDHTPDDPSVDALLRSPAGTMVHLCAADSRDYAFLEIQLVTARGCISMEELGFAARRRPVRDSIRFPGYRELGAGTFAAGGYPQAMAGMADNLHQWLTGNVPLASTGESALYSLELCHRIREAACP